MKIKVLFSIDDKIITALNSVSRNELKNKSALVELLLENWLIQCNYASSGSLK